MHAKYLFFYIKVNSNIDNNVQFVNNVFNNKTSLEQKKKKKKKKNTLIFLSQQQTYLQTNPDKTRTNSLVYISKVNQFQSLNV